MRAVLFGSATAATLRGFSRSRPSHGLISFALQAVCLSTACAPTTGGGAGRRGPFWACPPEELWRGSQAANSRAERSDARPRRRLTDLDGRLECHQREPSAGRSTDRIAPCVTKPPGIAARHAKPDRRRDLKSRRRTTGGAWAAHRAHALTGGPSCRRRRAAGWRRSVPTRR